MTREDKLYSMRMIDLKAVADKLGIKINTKAAKSKAIEKILEAEAREDAAWEEPQKKNREEADKEAEDTFNKKHHIRNQSEPIKNDVDKHSEAPKKQAKNNTKPKSKRINMKLSELTYKGETKSIKAWAEELKIPYPTLYDRVNRNGWAAEEAIETPLGQRRSK